jgi:hypothetical protein
LSDRSKPIPNTKPNKEPACFSTLFAATKKLNLLKTDKKGMTE